MLYHVTHIGNIQNIWAKGLRTCYSQGRAARCWLVAEWRILWAIEHVCERHGWRSQDVIIVMICEAGQPLRRHSQDGLYWTADDVPTDRLVGTFRLQRQYLGVEAEIDPPATLGS